MGIAVATIIFIIPMHRKQNVDSFSRPNRNPAAVLLKAVEDFSMRCCQLSSLFPATALAQILNCFLTVRKEGRGRG